jgi:S1-C subfamily serine protease
VTNAPKRTPNVVAEEAPVPASNVPWIVGGAVACTLVLAITAVVITLMMRNKEKDKAEPDPVAVAPRPTVQPPGSVLMKQPLDAGGTPLRPVVPLPDLTPPPPVEASAKPPVDPTPAPVDTQPIAKGRLTAEARDKVKRATVYLRVTLPDGRKASGTGFFGVVGETNLVLTNAHVVGMIAPRARRPKQIEVFVNSGQSDEKRTTASVLGVDRASDLAVLRIESVPGLPTPLVVKSANGLGELDEVFVFGFPLGENLGKEITIRPSSVSSLRKKNGVLERIQVNGGMDPGNSGGPVVDAAGDVIGVAVSGIPGRQINFAIPADRVGGMLNGRIQELGMGQTYKTKTGVAVPMNMVMIDPRGQVRKPAVEVWIGDKGTGRRPPTASQPPLATGDTPHKRFELTDYDRVTGVARGDVELPELPAGKEYWMQPVWVNAAGREQWAAANSFPLPNLPVERKPALLVARQQNSRRTLTLTNKTTLRIGASDEEQDGFVITSTAKLSEQVGNASNQGADVLLKYLSLDRQLSAPGRPARTSPMLEKLKPFQDRMVGLLRVDAFGKLVQNDLDVRYFQGLPAPVAEGLKNLHQPTQAGLEAMTILMPNKEVPPGERWKGRTSLPIDEPGRLQLGEMDVTYTYLGRRHRNGREEAVISLDGVVRQGRGGEVDLGGTASGIAVVDLGTGRISSAKTTVTVEVEVNISEAGEKSDDRLPEKIRVLATVEVRLERQW